ncbi:MAG: cyclase family protein [Candidatus Obscuribacterales bacterium]|nr:cyclase family protein [Candidatus Obscuribacterales bacterium]
MSDESFKLFDLSRSVGFDEVESGPPYRGTVTVRYCEDDFKDYIASLPADRREQAYLDIVGEIRYHPLKHYIGPAIMIEVQRSADGSIRAESLQEHLDHLKTKLARGANPSHIELPSRILIKTGWSPAENGYPYLNNCAIDRLDSEGVKLVGIDTPSIDRPMPCEPANSSLFKRKGMIWLVSLDLSAFTRVQVGMLLAAPVDQGRTGPAPVRAVLVKGKGS